MYSVMTWVVWAAIVSLHTTAALNFLLAPIQLRSHVIEHVAVGKALTSRGHAVFMVTSEGFPWETMVEMTQIKLLTFRYPGAGNLTFYSQSVVGAMARSYDRESSMRVMALEMCDKMMADSEFLAEVRRRQIYMTLVDPWPIAPCMLVLPTHLGLPYVVLSSAYLPEGALPLLPSFVPAPTSRYTDRMSFWQRFSNMLHHYRPPATGNSVSPALLQKYPPPQGHVLDTWSDAIRHSVLFIWTRDHILEFPFPVMPKYLTLPGLTQTPKRSLPREIDSYMSDAEGGVVLVSFGPTFDHVPTDLVKTLLLAFKRLPNQSFIFKLPRVIQKDIQIHHPGLLPSNVWLVTWYPQNDVLGHRNTKGFVSHCGSDSQYEALYHGVPTVGIPLDPDHFRNCDVMHVRHYGICLRSGVTQDHVISALRDLMVDKSYTNNVTKMSNILKDQPLPSDTVAWWLQHVATYGTAHLESASVELTQFQLWMFDVCMFCASVVTALVVCSVILFLYVRRVSDLDRQKWD